MGLRLVYIGSQAIPGISSSSKVIQITQVNSDRRIQQTTILLGFDNITMSQSQEITTYDDTHGHDHDHDHDEKPDHPKAAQTSAEANMIANAQRATMLEHGMTLKQGLKLYPKAILWSALISTLCAMEGYDISLIGNFCLSLHLIA